MWALKLTLSYNALRSSRDRRAVACHPLPTELRVSLPRRDLPHPKPLGEVRAGALPRLLRRHQVSVSVSVSVSISVGG